MHRWKPWLQELPKLEQLEIDRYFKSADFGEISSSQLHHFSDASQKRYGAVTYLRITDHYGNVKCSFVMGKSRLAPLKPVTIPRMELSAAVIATRLDNLSRKGLSLPIDQSFFWTDSTCVLRYIENQDKRFQTFVANRVATIHVRIYSISMALCQHTFQSSGRRIKRRVSGLSPTVDTRSRVPNSAK